MKTLTLAALLLAASTAFATTTSVVTPAASAASAPKACVPSPAVTCGVKAKPKAKPVQKAEVQQVIVPVEKIVIQEKEVIKEVKVPTALPTQPNAWKVEMDYLYDNSVKGSGMRLQVDSPWNLLGFTPIAQYDYIPNVYQRTGLGLQYPLAKMENSQFLVVGTGFYQDTAYVGSNTGGGSLGLKVNTAITPKLSLVSGAQYNWVGTGKDGAALTLGLNYAF